MIRITVRFQTTEEYFRIRDALMPLGLQPGAMRNKSFYRTVTFQEVAKETPAKTKSNGDN